MLLSAVTGAMRAEPSAELIGLLERLDLAGADRVRSLRGRVKRLARDLPLFESVWVDALQQQRILTPYQATQINAGRGESLAVGPYVLCRPAGSLGYGEVFLARRRRSRDLVRLTLLPPVPGRHPDVLQALETLVHKASGLDTPSLAPVTEFGGDERNVWAVSRHVPGCTAADWMVSNGRFPPEAVLEIARHMLTGLAMLESVGLVHGDLAPAGVVLAEGGEIVLSPPGLRPIFRPDESSSHANLVPEAYDYLAPERITRGSAPDARSEVFACGCLWWHLLTGRPPLAGGNALIKIRAAQAAKIPDVRLLAPDTPVVLAEAVTAAVHRDPLSRPESMRELSAMLGPSTKRGRATLRRCLTNRDAEAIAWSAPARAVRHWQQNAVMISAVVGCLIAVVAIVWTVWQAGAAKTPAVAVADHPDTPASLSTSASTAEPPVSEPPVPAVEPPKSPLPEADSPRSTLILPAETPVAIDPRHIRPDQTVRGEAGKRPLVVLPSAGLALRHEDVVFENVDFVWDASVPDGPGRPTMIDVRASHVEFHGCSFQSARPGKLPTAIAWTWPADADVAEQSLPSAEMRIRDCVFRSVSAGVVCDTRAAVMIALDNTLYSGSGPLLEFERYPRVDQPAVVRLTAVTLRESGPLVHWRWDSSLPPGVVSIAAELCVLAPSGQTALLSIASAADPNRLLTKIRWSGQGSLISPAAAVVQWLDDEGRLQPVDDTAMSIAGLVRSEVEFAGPAGSNPDGSRVVRWQVPLQSSAAPGADPSRLAAPPSRASGTN